jgi:soluble lytic murein transglycosylase
MTYLRQEKYDKARPLFQELMSNRLISYYSLAAQNRFNSIPGVEVIRNLASSAAYKGSSPPPWEASRGEESLKESREESEELLARQDREESEGEVNDEGIVEEGWDDEETLQLSDFENPKMAARFQRATDFIRLGLYEWGRWELYGIEKRTRDKDDLVKLAKAYESIRSYNRSAYIGEWRLSKKRKEHGILGVRYLWEYSYPRAFRKEVEQYSELFNVPKELVWAIIRAESMFKPSARSPVGAQGLMQLMPNTAKQVARLLGDSSFVERDIARPEVNIRLGTRYLNRLLRKFENQVPIAAASYNAGPHRSENWLANFGTLEMDEFIEHIPFLETRNYVKKVVRYYGIYKQLYGSPKTLNLSRELAWLSQPIPIKIKRRPATRESWEQL